MYFENIPKIAKAAGIVNGYRIISNCGDDGCQSVKHLHFHVIGGEKLSEKMVLIPSFLQHHIT